MGGALWRGLSEVIFRRGYWLGCGMSIVVGAWSFRSMWGSGRRWRRSLTTGEVLRATVESRLDEPDVRSRLLVDAACSRLA